jgi:transcriptional regulator with XRE-family HTH domain
MELRIARQIARLTQQELADRAGVNISFISLLERGKRDFRNVGYETVIRIASALGVDPELLFPVDQKTARPKPPRKARTRRAAM